jgi:NADH-quinone oxidoreductase subunit C
MTAEEIVEHLRRAWPDAAIDAAASADMPTIYVDREHLLEVFETLRDDPSLQFSLFVDVTAADYLPAEPRFEVVYHLACLGAAYRTSGVVSATRSKETTPEGLAGRAETTPDVLAPPSRLRVKVRVPGTDPRVPSAITVYPAAGWPEREVFDLFGLSFDRHPDLRRILTPDGWEGYPLRRDYPVQVRKDTPSWSPIQLSPEEFAANIRAERERATRQARSRAERAEGGSDQRP